MEDMASTSHAAQNCQQQQYTPKINLRNDAKAKKMKHVAAKGNAAR
jgi:hypothetical protein